jgi:hypothetical protein
MRNALQLAQGFHDREFATFTEAAMQDDPSWILLGVHEQPADKLPWQSRKQRMWFCLLVAAAEGEISKLKDAPQ